MPETIVIIEDDESIREMLRYYFRSVGYEVGNGRKHMGRRNTSGSASRNFQ